MEGLEPLVARDAMLRVDLEPPCWGSAAVQLLVEPVPDPADPLCKQQSWCGSVGEDGRALPGVPDDDPARDAAEQDPSPHAEAALPDLEDPLPLRVGHFAPARDVVVEACADDPGRDTQTATRSTVSQSPPRRTYRTPVSATHAAIASRSIRPYMWTTNGPRSIVPRSGEGMEAITSRDSAFAGRPMRAAKTERRGAQPAPGVSSYRRIFRARSLGQPRWSRSTAAWRSTS